MTEYCTALYSPKGDLVKTSPAFPVETTPQPQLVADLVALAAGSGSNEHNVGEVLVWVDPNATPPARIEDATPDARRTFGPAAPPVPRYRWVRGPGWTITLVPQS